MTPRTIGIGNRAASRARRLSRLIAQLARLWMVERTGGGDVIAGGALATLQPTSPATALLGDRLRPLLIEMVNSFGEDAAFAVDDGDALLYLLADLAGPTPLSVTAAGPLRERLERIATEGHAWAAEELEIGINGLAVAVRIDSEGCGALSMYGPSDRFSSHLCPTLATDLVELVAKRLGT